MHRPVNEFYMEPMYISYVRVRYEEPMSAIMARGMRMKTPSGNVHATLGNAVQDALAKEAVDKHLQEKYGIQGELGLTHRMKEGAAHGGKEERQAVHDARKAKAAQAEITKEEQLLKLLGGIPSLSGPDPEWERAAEIQHEPEDAPREGANKRSQEQGGDAEEVAPKRSVH